MALSSFSLAKTCALVGYSAALWASGIVAIRHGGPACGRTNLRRTITMAATVPAVYFLIRITETLFSLKSQELLPAFALGGGVASILDGITHTWFPTAYENPSLQKTNALAACTFSRYGSGWLLYFVGLSLVMALYM